MRIPLSDAQPPRPRGRRDGHGKTKTLQAMAEQLSAAGVPVFVADVKGDVSGLAVAGESGGRGGEAHGRARPAVRARRRSRSSSSRWAGSAPASRCAPRCRTSGPQLLAKVLDANETQEQSLALVFHYADEKGLPLLDLSDLRALLTFLDSDAGKAELEGIGGLSSATVGVLLRGAGRCSRTAAATSSSASPSSTIADLMRTAPDGRGIVSCLELARRPGQAQAVLDGADVAGRRAVRGAARGRRPREAQARVLLRRGASALRRRDRRLPGLRDPDRAPDPLEGRGRLLRHPEPDGRPRRGARAARQPRPARAARLHARRRQGAEGDGLHVPQVELLRPRAAADRAWGSARRR